MFKIIPIDNFKSPHHDKDGRFAKGITPANKGKKMCAELKKKVQHTFFKKGNIPHNTKEDGVITQRLDKRGVPQLFIRVSLGKWKYYKVYIYESYYGTLSNGDVIRFIDGNTLNCDIANLQKITKADNLKLNKQLNKQRNEIDK